MHGACRLRLVRSQRARYRSAEEAEDEENGQNGVE